MTEAEIQTILLGIYNFWDELTPAEVKCLLRVLAAHEEYPRCAACKKPIENFKDFSWDHIIAKRQGGPDDIRNMTPMHVDCNVKKGSVIDETYFCHIEPDLLKSMEPMLNNKTKKQTKKHNGDERRKHRNHVRVNGWADNNGHRR